MGFIQHGSYTCISFPRLRNKLPPTQWHFCGLGAWAGLSWAFAPKAAVVAVGSRGLVRRLGYRRTPFRAPQVAAVGRGAWILAGWSWRPLEATLPAPTVVLRAGGAPGRPTLSVRGSHQELGSGETTWVSTRKADLEWTGQRAGPGGLVSCLQDAGPVRFPHQKPWGATESAIRFNNGQNVYSRPRGNEFALNP